MDGIGWADDLYPLFSNPILERLHPYFVFAENLVENDIHIHGFPNNGTEVLWNASQIGYEIFRLAGKLVRLVCHEFVFLGSELLSVQGIRHVEIESRNLSAVSYCPFTLNSAFPGLPC